MNLVNLESLSTGEFEIWSTREKGMFAIEFMSRKNCIFQNVVKLSNIAVELTLFVNFPMLIKQDETWKF